MATKECPDLIYWLLPQTGIVLKSLPHHKGCHDSKKRRSMKPYVPFGVVAFRTAKQEEWTPISQPPKE
jgi:hypothetical protein